MKLKQWPIGALVLALGSLSLGLTYGARADDDDPPGRAAHLSYSTGSVSFRPASVDDWSAASRNYPLTTGDSLWSDRDSRAELQIGSSIVRLGPETAFSFLNLDDRTAQMRISEGELSVRVARLDEDDVVEVDTPNAAVSLLRPGFYRIDVRPEGDETIVTVRNGEADVTSGGASFSVRSRESAYVSGYDSPSYDVREARGRDAWEDWSDDRDRRVERSVSSRYVSREMVGYSDLDEHGSWREGTEYGAVWFPNRVDAGWAPYRHGRWAWVYPWGWTWVDDSPWGFAPFHYGRWAHVGGRWGWCPGTVVARPVYAPALVVFLGGDRWGASLSIGDGVGWLPLGPREVYVPPYAHSQTYIRNVNITQVNVTNINITNVTRGDATFVNQRVRGAVTAVPRNDFVQSRSIAKTAVVVPETAVRSARMASGGQVVGQIKPRRESVVGMNAPRPAKAPPRGVDRPVVVRQAPPAPVKLEEQEKPRAERRRPNPLVRPAAPETGGAVKLRPARPDVPKAEPVSPRDAQRAPRPRTGPPSARPERNERPGEKTPATERQQPGTDVQPPQGTRPKPEEPPTRQAPRAEPDERRPQKAEPDGRRPPRAEPDERRPQKAEPDERRPQKAEPDERRPPPAEPDERRPQKAEPDERRPPRAEPDERRPQKAEPDERRPQQAEPDQRRPPRAEPDERRPQKPEPDERKPPRAAPDERRPQKAEPDERRPPRAAPDERRPQKAEPDERRPPRAAPDERRPQKAAPDERKPPRAAPQATPEGRPGRPAKPKPSPSPSPKKE